MERLTDQPSVLLKDAEVQPPVPQQRTGRHFGKPVLIALTLSAAFAATTPAAPAFDREPGSESVNCDECVFSPDQARAIGHQAIAGQQLDLSVQNDSKNHDRQAFTKPHLQLGTEDDAVVASTSPARVATATEQARSMGADWWRTIVYPTDVLRHRWKKYDLAVSEATSKGLNVNLTLACNDEHWTDQKFQRYVTAVTQRYDSKGVREYSICNEPNFPSWLNRMPHETTAQTYRRLYQIGYNAVKNQAQVDKVDDHVFIFEVSSEIQPLKFIKAALACPPSQSNSCPPLETDGFAYHPYQLTTRPTKSSNIAGEVGIGSLPLLESVIKAEYDAGKIETPDHQEPKLELTEFAYLVQSHHSKTSRLRHVKSRYLPDKIRQQYYLQVLKIVCSDEDVDSLLLYEVDSPLPDSKGPWNSSLFTAKGKPYGSYKAVQSFTQTHPGCIAGN